MLNLSNLNVVPMDIDGDGRSDLLHMPRLRTYGWWAPTRQADATVASVSPAQQGWAWTYASIDLPAGDTDPRIDLGRDGQHIRVMDVNNDHLIDVVRTTGTVMQTWINLGFLPGGDGRFGSYAWTGTQWSLSTQPFESCLLHAGTPIDFEDPEVRLADLNGDGLQDIAKVRRGRIIYWPGRGEGVWGEGSRECARGEGAGRYIEMARKCIVRVPDQKLYVLIRTIRPGHGDSRQKVCIFFRDVFLDDLRVSHVGRGFAD